MRTRRIVLPSVGSGPVELEVAEAAPAGGSGRPLLLTHGFCGTKEDFTGYLELLAALGWHVVAPDLRGHGGSGRPVGQAAYSLELFSADLLALADELGWRSFVLLGHSMGGMIAQVLALSAPQRLAGLVLMDTSHGSPDGFDPAVVEVGRQVVAGSGLATLVEMLRDMEDPLTSPAHVRLCDIRPGYRAWSEAKTLGVAPDMWLAMSRSLLDQGDRLDALGSLRVPTLVICGDQDLAFMEPSRRMAKVIPGARLAVIGDGGHSPQFESPDEWWREMSGFLARVAGE